MVRLLGVLTIALFLPAVTAFGQQPQSDTSDNLPVPIFEPPSDVPEAVGFFASLFVPKLLQDIGQLREYIQSDEFASFRRRYGDVRAVDALFHRAMKLSWNNAYEALFISMFATIELRRLGINLPFLGPLLWFPLTPEFEDEFWVRVSALPRKLYADTPRGETGDRDKLQHFFGSAFLAYVFESGDGADRVGNAIEMGEREFVVGGAADERDVRANKQGQEFGLHLLHDKSLHPSLFLRSRRAQEGP